jgi:two-component system cell cycle response regulator DivK
MMVKKLLIAEDDPASRELLREILQAQGYQVVEAEDGQAALNKIEEESPDLVLLDIQMPKLDGLGVVRRLRQNPRFTSLPVIAVTSYAMRGDREKALGAGFDAYITKPIDPVGIRETVERLLWLAESPTSS